jgi:hypothetical protein
MASFLIRKLITITAAIADARIAAITAAIIAAITAAIAATVDTARRRNTAGRRRRRNIDLATAAAAAPVIAADPIRDGTIATGEEAKCFGLGRNDGGSECESCRGHDNDPAEFQHHDTSPVIYLAVSPHLDCSLPTETSNKAQAGISERLSRDISRYGKFEDRRVFADGRPSGFF